MSMLWMVLGLLVCGGLRVAFRLGRISERHRQNIAQEDAWDAHVLELEALQAALNEAELAYTLARRPPLGVDINMN